MLYDDLAFEVRWAVAGESIVVQLVAKLGKSLAQSYAETLVITFISNLTLSHMLNQSNGEKIACRKMTSKCLALLELIESRH